MGCVSAVGCVPGLAHYHDVESSRSKWQADRKRLTGRDQVLQVTQCSLIDGLELDDGLAEMYCNPWISGGVVHDVMVLLVYPIASHTLLSEIVLQFYVFGWCPLFCGQLLSYPCLPTVSLE